MPFTVLGTGVSCEHNVKQTALWRVLSGGLWAQVLAGGRALLLSRSLPVGLE